jgi:hypothetical protein
MLYDTIEGNVEGKFTPSRIRPINGYCGDKQGKYALFVRANRTTLKPGSRLWLSIGVTGYGEIGGSFKISWTFPHDFIDSSDSYGTDVFATQVDPNVKPQKAGSSGTVFCVNGGVACL